MNQRVLMNADINECAEVSHISNHAFQNHVRLQVIHRGYFLIESNDLEFLPRISTRPSELVNDVDDGR